MRAALILLLLLPLAGRAQEREVVFNQVTVSSQEAAISVEFADGGTLAVALRDGRVVIDGRDVGTFARGDGLDQAWRALLGRAMAADNGQVASLLAEWTAPSGLAGGVGRAAAALEEAFTAALGAAPAPEAPAIPALSPAQERDLLRSLLARPERLAELAGALARLELSNVQLHLGEDVHVAAGEVIEGTLLVVDATATVDGVVEGDVVLIDGTLVLGDEARVTGDVRWTDASIAGNRAGVGGAIREIEAIGPIVADDLREQLAREIRDSLAEATRATQPRASTRAPRTRPSPFRSIARGIGGLIQTAISWAILVGLGLAALYFFPRHVEIVARTARNAPGRATVVGLAGLVLAFPAWIVGIVLLAITIIGIPVMLLWLPAFPLALALAIVLGLLAVAMNLGGWVSRRQFERLEGFDTSRPAAQLGVGLGVLLSAFALAHVFEMAGSALRAFQVLVLVGGGLFVAVAGTVGLGAVILSRGGRDPSHTGGLWDLGENADPFAPGAGPFEPGPMPGGGAGDSGTEPTDPGADRA